MLKGILVTVSLNSVPDCSRPERKVMPFGTILRVRNIDIGQVMNGSYEVNDHRMVSPSSDQSLDDFLHSDSVSRSFIQPHTNTRTIHDGSIPFDGPDVFGGWINVIRQTLRDP